MELEVDLGPAERDRSYYQYLPFTVGEGWPSVALEVVYDRASAVVDLGLLGPGGFRGWSGGARSLVQVAEAWATPGYLPGPLAGDWSVWLGLYQVPEQGVRLSVAVGPGPGAAPPAEALPPVPADVPTLVRPPARPGYRWVAGDLHCHSHHSDGALSVDELAVLARKRGLDFLAVTDHNTVSHFPELGPAGARYGVTLLAGQEVTTPQGHANCIGEVPWADFRTPPDEWMAQAESEGGMASLNHPVLGSLSWRMALARRPSLMELWHSSWDRRDGAALGFWASLGTPVAIGGSDFHRPGDIDATGAALLPGCPTTWVEVRDDHDGLSPSPQSIIEGLRAGAVTLSASPTSPVIVRRGEELVVRGGEGASVVVLSEPSEPFAQARHFPVRTGRTSLKVGQGTCLLMAEEVVLALCA